MGSMTFRNFGGIYQFVVADENDLSRIDSLDPARWAATSAPVGDLHSDEGFLHYVDPGATGRVRVTQIVGARDWAFARLSNRQELFGRREAIALSSIAKGDAGDKLRAAAERVNREQKADDATKVTLANVRAFKSSYRKLLANGDGVMPPEVVPEAEVAAAIKDVMATVGAAPDRGGSDGVTMELLEKFKAQGQAWLDWRAKSDAASLWGADTDAASALVLKMDPKLHEFFLMCELRRQESPTDAVLKLTDDQFRALWLKDAPEIEEHLTSAPVAPPNVQGVLDLDGPLNGLFRDDLGALRKVIDRVLGAPTRELTREKWTKVVDAFAGYRTWLKAKVPENFDALGADKVKAFLAGPLPARIAHFVDLDKAAADELAQVDDLEKLMLYVRWLVDLVNNFVNLSAIYKPSEQSLVEVGSLVIDGRRLDFCMKVEGHADHKNIAKESLIFLVYAKITAKQGGAAAYEVVAPLTGGERGRLRVGKRGIFYDIHGVEWDAEIVDLVENPISVREAVFAPFRRAAKFVGDKVEEWVGSAAEAQEKGLSDATANATTQARSNLDAGMAAARNPVPPPPAAPAAGGAAPEGGGGGGLNINTIVLGGGMALAGLGAVLASLFSALTSIAGWAAIIGVVLAVMLFSALNAWLKLRKRDMSLLLEANGWAMNVYMKITARVAQVFAYTPDLPKDAQLDHKDLLPAADDEGGHSGVYVFLLVLLAALSLASYWSVRTGKFHQWMHPTPSAAPSAAPSATP